MAGLASKKLSQSELQTRRTRVDDEEDVGLTYKLGKELGRGAFGVVLEGTQLSSGKVFAVKVIPKERVSGAVWLARHNAPLSFCCFGLCLRWQLLGPRETGLACRALDYSALFVLLPVLVCVQSRGVRCDVTLCHTTCNGSIFGSVFLKCCLWLK